MAKIKLHDVHEDIDPAVLNEALMKGSKDLPSLSRPKPQADEPAPVQPAAIAQAPKVSRPAKSDVDFSRARKTKSLMLPQYVWDWFKAEERRTGEPQNSVVLRTLKAGGAPVREEDLGDQRMKKRD